MPKKDSWIHNLIRHQGASFIATLADFGSFNLFLYGFGVWYVTSNIVGALIGATLNFILSSYWAFSGSQNSLKSQVIKYTIVSIGSLILNTFFIYLLTDLAQFEPNLSKVIIAITIGISYNFVLMRYYVFKK